MSEIELKFVFDASHVRELRARLHMFEKSRRAKSVRSIYFDTPEHALDKAGLSLRLRRTGKIWFQTVKTRSAPQGGLSQVKEIECTVPSGKIDLEQIPDLLIRMELRKLVDGASLQPVFETAMLRASTQLALEDGSQAELALDVGQIIAGGKIRDFRELELELVDGNIAALYDFARPLYLESDLRFSRLAKADRGYRLANGGEIDLDPAIRFASDVHLQQDDTSEQAATVVLRECFEQVSANVDFVGVSDAVDGVHQLRIGLRRLRSGFSVFKAALDCTEMRRLNVEAKWLAGVAGKLRDLDVAIVDVLEPEIRVHPEEPGFSVLKSAIQVSCNRARKEVRSNLRSERCKAFLFDLAAFIELKRWRATEENANTANLTAPASHMAKRSLAKLWKEAKRRARGINSLPAEERHELRKELKKLRYAIEFFGSLYSRREVASFSKRLKKLQTVFGELNDAEMARTMFLGEGRPAADNLAAQRASGLIIGARVTKAEIGWSKAKALWRELSASKPF